MKSLESQKRNKSFGEGHQLTLVDKLGVYLSNYKVVSLVKKEKPARIIDIGCGYNAHLLKGLRKYSKNLVGVDVSVDRKIKGVQIYEKTIDDSLDFLEDASFDLVIINSVLEHLDNPVEILREAHRILSKKGILFGNVPNWFGKYALEMSAFRLSLSPASEMNDHKMYYGKKDIWPLLVKAGFKPQNIRIKYHKLFLNTLFYARK